VNAWIAYVINERYYDGSHYIWAAIGGEQAMRPPVDMVSPPSSTPMAICERLKSDIRNKDYHSAKVNSLKEGIIRGANFRLKQGVITSEVHDEILQVLGASQLEDYWPLLYVIPFDGVSQKIVTVPVPERAHPLSLEYRITDLRRNEFDLLEFMR
jgi:hypothetical protein